MSKTSNRADRAGANSDTGPSQQQAVREQTKVSSSKCISFVINNFLLLRCAF